MTELGVHSEVGKLRKVSVHRPGLALSRLTPSNCQELLFDDVIWVKQGRVEHHAFTDVMRHSGVEVYFVRELLEEALRDAEARKWLLDRKIREEIVRSKGRPGASAAPRHVTGLNSRGGGNVTGKNSDGQSLGSDWSV